MILLRVLNILLTISPSGEAEREKTKNLTNKDVTKLGYSEI